MVCCLIFMALSFQYTRMHIPIATITMTTAITMITMTMVGLSLSARGSVFVSFTVSEINTMYNITFYILH